MSPTDEAPDSSWLEKVSEESNDLSDMEWSEVRMERDDVDDDDGEKLSGEKPESMK